MDQANSNSVSGQRVLPLEGGLNIRDLGGYVGSGGRRIRWRQLFRSGTTHYITAADRQTLMDLQIRAVVELRSDQERADHPHGLASDEGIVHLTPVLDQTAGNLLKLAANPKLDAPRMHAIMIRTYMEFPYSLSGIYAQLLQHAACGPLPLIFGCAAGKDRTGVAAAVLLSALGVSWDDILADYLLTTTVVPDIMRIFSRTTAGKAIAQLDPAITEPLFAADANYLLATRASIESRSGSMHDYLRIHLGIDEPTLAALRLRLLE